jgi:hypothetical protein
MDMCENGMIAIGLTLCHASGPSGESLAPLELIGVEGIQSAGRVLHPSADSRYLVQRPATAHLIEPLGSKMLAGRCM